MSINNLNTYLNVRDAHLRVVSGNVYAQAMNIGGINVETAHGLQSVSNTGNATSLTLEFANVTTGFVTTANAQIGRDLVVTGNATVSTDLTVSANATVTDTLTVSEHLLASKEATVTGNLHVTTIRSDSNVVAEYTGPHDRPLRKYPEVAFPLQGSSESAASGATTFTYKSYTVTSNSVYSGTNYKISNAFDGTATSWSGNLGDYDSNGDVASGRTANYLQIQLPNAIKLENIKIISEANYEYANGPRNITLYGSNNGSDWVTLKTETDLPLNGGTTNPDPQTAFVHVNTTTKYLYYKLEISKIWISSGGATYARIGEWELYGHEEGSGSLDTTLKTVYNVPATTGTQLEVYYDAKDLDNGSAPTNPVDLSPNTNNATLGGDPQVSNGAFVFDGNDYISTTVTGLTGSSVTMSIWVNVNSIDTSRINSIIGLGTYDTGTAGSSTWIAIDSSQRFYTGLVGLNQTVENSTSAFTNNWVHLTAIAGTTELSLYQDGLLIGKVNGGTFNLGSNPVLYLGTRSDGSGNPESTRYFNGSIANFRLYSKALNAGQVQELYDYQKDYFLGSKSQLTLYKGHLGVGVTEPSGQLELAGDERIQEYPPGPMSDYETLIPGHGVFCVYASTVRNSSWEAWEAFNGDTSNDSRWISLDTYTGSEDTYNGSARLYSSAPLGEYVVLKLPYPIKLSSARVYGKSGSPDSNNERQGPERGQIWGSNDGVIWEHVINYDFGDYQQEQWNEINNINSTKYYSQYGFIVTKKLNNTYTAGGTTQGDYVAVTEIQYFGTPGPTTLDKGSLTLGRSLDVPRVSRYDVDTETPRPEKLVVDFDTTVNSSPTDISGKGNHGTFSDASGVPTYSAADKAFDFDGVNGAIWSGPLSPTMTGDKICSMSAWFKTTNASTVNQTIMWLGTYSVGALLMVAVTNGTLRISIGSGCSLDVAGVIESNTWYHVVGIKQGTGSITSSNFSSTYKLYLNGEPVTGTFGGTARTLSITTNYWYIGAGNSTGAEAFSGYISNPKLYDTILEPSEIKKLYRLGRTGRSMVISDTAVGIGKVPEAQLDVRGNLNVSSFIKYDSAWFYAYDGDTDGSGSFNNYTGYVPWAYLMSGSKHFTTASASTSGGYYTAPVDGIYHFDTSVLNYPDARSGITGIHFSVNDRTDGTNYSSGYNRKTNMPGQENMNASLTTKLNEGDTVKVYVVNMDCYTQTNHAFFSGYLITRI